METPINRNRNGKGKEYDLEKIAHYTEMAWIMKGGEDPNTRQPSSAILRKMALPKKASFIMERGHFFVYSAPWKKC